MLRAIFNLFRLWGVTEDQASIMLDVPRRTLARWKAGASARFSRDGKARLSNLLAFIRLCGLSSTNLRVAMPGSKLPTRFLRAFGAGGHVGR
jgi:hypothetical protein